jgi:hypothetical protein
MTPTQGHRWEKTVVCCLVSLPWLALPRLALPCWLMLITAASEPIWFNQRATQASGRREQEVGECVADSLLGRHGMQPNIAPPSCC